MNLKSTDLMIGNYVKVKTNYIDNLDTKKEGFLMSVSIKEQETIRQVDAYLLESLMKQEQGIIKEDVIGYLYVEPIPLTKEILAKNGFVNGEGRLFVGEVNASFCKEDKDEILELTEGKNEKFYWTINYDEYRILRLDYVHELQQAIHLCRINKDFVL